MWRRRANGSLWRNQFVWICNIYDLKKLDLRVWYNSNYISKIQDLESSRWFNNNYQSWRKCDGDAQTAHFDATNSSEFAISMTWKNWTSECDITVITSAKFRTLNAAVDLIIIIKVDGNMTETRQLLTLTQSIPVNLQYFWHEKHLRLEFGIPAISSPKSRALSRIFDLIIIIKVDDYTDGTALLIPTQLAETTHLKTIEAVSNETSAQHTTAPVKQSQR